MHRPASRALLLSVVVAVAAACAGDNPAGVRQPAPDGALPVHAALQCRVDVRAETFACASAAPQTAPGVSPLIVGGEGLTVRLVSTGTRHDPAAGVVRTSVAVENLLATALGTMDGTFPSPEGVRVFFQGDPVVTEGTGAVAVENPDGEGMVTEAAQKYFRYAGLLAPRDTTAAREWRFGVSGTVTRFSFTVYVAAAMPGSGTPGAGIVLLGGQGRADTVDAVQDTLLRIGVRGADGGPAVNTVVYVESVRASTSPFWEEMQVEHPAVPGFGSWTNGTTDAQGTFTVRVRMGRRAGAGRLVVTAPTLSLRDTARYTILPGAAAQVQSLPGDTTVLLGGRVPLSAAVRDRYGNPRADAVVFQVAAGPGTLEGSTVVAGSSIGRVAAVASAGGVRDTSFVRVVPPGTVASVTRSGTGYEAALYTFSLDGSHIRRLRGSVTGPGYNGEMSAAWLGPDRLVYHDNNWNHTRQLYVMDLETGAAERFLAPADQMEMEIFPRASPDGSWVYFGGGTSSRQAVYRARADGGGAELITSLAGPPYSEWGADASPDGTRIVYMKAGVNWNQEELYVMDLATRTATPLGVMGVSPRWSPDGTSIAFISPSAGARVPMVMNADGTGARALSTTILDGDLGWSPDGRYIVAATNYAYQLVIIEVATGAQVLVDYPGIVEGPKSPVWRP